MTGRDENAGTGGGTVNTTLKSGSNARPMSPRSWVVLTLNVANGEASNCPFL